ncbi:MAG: hypothetical protein GYA42_07265, partial [Syntrophomonadaceae bacterium]|nr:hypothetical protein [Syntrophomonadaceae bacterium]
MRVAFGRVTMFVAMGAVDLEIMRMVVMAVLMVVAVFVSHFRMHMAVDVMLENSKIGACKHQDQGQGERGGQGFAQNY